MLPWSLVFNAPGWLWLLALVPLLWWWSLRSLSGLGRGRKWLALGLRTLVLLAVILSLAEIRFHRTSEKLTVVYLLDQSLSIPDDTRRLMIRYVNEEIRQHRKAATQDNAGVIVFAREATIEHPPHAAEIRIPETIESRIETDATNLAGAIKLAQATLPEDSAGRIVIICDGNENLGDAREQARRLAEVGVGIDVVPIRYPARAEVAVEKLTIPTDVNSGQPFDIQVVLNNLSPAQKNQATRVPGKLKIVRKSGGREETLSEQEVNVAPGKQVFTVREEIKGADFYTYEAHFTPASKAQDNLSQNNQASAFTQVRGQGQVLLIEYINEETGATGGDYDYLIQRLKEENLQVTKRNTQELFTSLGELQPFDSVILANVPREAFTDEQISLLVRNTQQMGAGLIMLGGEHSFGAGGWANTELEEALPVEFQIRNAKVAPVGALAMVIDRSGSMMGNKLQMAIEATIATIDVLQPWDYVTVTSFDSFGYMVVPATKKGEKGHTIKRQIANIGSGGGTNMEPGIRLAYEELKKVKDAATRHMIILTDGQTEGAGYEQMIRAIRKDGITVSTIAMGADADSALLASLAVAGQGKFYQVNSYKALPRIFMQEARKISRPLIYENQSGLQPIRKYPHEMLKGIEGTLPPFTGYVRTTVKNHPLVEVSLVAPLPNDGDEKYNTLLASWNFGLGKAVAWTTDSGRKWANSWTQSADYDRFFSQMVRWSMRPAGDTGKFTVNTEVQEGKVRLVITALDKEDEFLNFLSMGGSVLGPDMKPRDLSIKQVAPGRYVAEFPASTSGNYFAMLAPGQGMAPIMAGVNVPYSPEFLDREPNEALLRELAQLPTTGSEPGTYINGAKLEDWLAVDTFRHNLAKAQSSQDIWPWVLFAGACLFFADVFNRRVALDWGWLGDQLRAGWLRLRGQTAELAPAVAMNRLKSRKAELRQELDERRAAVTLHPVNSAGGAANAPLPTGDLANLESPTGKSSGHPLVNRTGQGSPSPAPPQTTTEEPDDAMSRLLKAKKKVWEDRQL
ncbi:MAG: VWA domain-containing protein [Pirellulales bacterium]|nr:VWA domain-containing protein [Pirellulales bacterium]